jgi:hypothetical protein
VPPGEVTAAGVPEAGPPPLPPRPGPPVAAVAAPAPGPATATWPAPWQPSARAPAPAPASPAAPPKATALQAVGGLGGALVGVAGSRYFGFALVYPFVFALVGGLILAKLGPKPWRPFVLGASLFIGHMGWMLAGALVLGTFAPVLADLILMGLGLVWLLLRPGLAPVIAIGLYQLVSMAVNVTQLLSGEAAGQEKFIVLHLLLRVGTVVALAVGYRAWRRGAQPASVGAVAGAFG